MKAWKAAALYLILAVISAAYLYPFVRTFSGAPDYGVFLNGADLLNHGAVPSRDFVEPQGPGSFLWLAIFFRVFGATLATARAVLNATGVGLALLTFYLSRRLGASGFFAAIFVLTMAVPLLPINSPHYDSNLFALGALAIFLLAWDQCLNGEPPSVWLLTAAAALCGVTTWMIQQKGLYLMGGMLVSLVYLLRAKAMKPALTLMAVYGAFVLLPFGVFASLRALPDVWYANYVWPMQKYSELNAAPYGFPIWRELWVTLKQHANRPVLQVLDVLPLAPYFLVMVLPLLLPIGAAMSGRRWLKAEMMPYWLAGYALWFAEMHRLDIGHLRNGVVLMAMLFFSLCEAGETKLWRRAGTTCTMMVVLVGGANLLGALDASRSLQTRRGEIRVFSDAAEDDASLLQFLEKHTRAGDEVFVYPYQPIYYFAEDLRNPTRYSYLQYHLHTDEQFREATLDLDRKKVRYVVFDTLLSGQNFAQIFPAYRQPEKSHLIMEPYLEEHYRVVLAAGRFHILERVQ